MILKSLVLKLIIPVIVAGFIFGYLHVYRDGWDAMTYAGADPWALFFVSLGSVTVPLIVAFIVAGLFKLIRRESGFLNIWLTMFLISVTFFFYSSSTVARYERKYTQNDLSPELIEILKTSHAPSCAVAIRNQSETLGLGITEAGVERYCRCVGAAYFDSFTQADFDTLQQTSELPRHILIRREDIQAECFVNSVSE